MVDFFKRWVLGFMMLSQKIISYIPSHIIRNFFYRYIFRVKMGKGVTIYSGVEMRSPWKVEIGENSIIGNDCLLDGRRGLKIGKNVNISSGVWIWTLHHDPQSPTFAAVGDKVVIGDFVWLCSRSTVLPGVKVGEGAVLAASGVAVKDIPSYVIVGGVPAKEIAKRSKELTYCTNYRVPFV